ncbi:MAG TPA: hypothetical protein PLD15_12215 [Mesotoga sp.]|nr:hypothetical protein [Mesotoga sp.]
MTILKVRVLVAAFITLAVFSFAGLLSGPADRFRLELDYESGFTGVIFHTVQFGQGGTVFNYVKDGGQDVLFPFERFTASVGIDRHTVYFLYQPLTVQTKVKLKSDLLVDDVLFPAGTGMVLNYGFPFYRLSYTYDVLRKGDSYLALGLSLQIRNADIYFESLDGTKFVANKNVGPVPVIKIKGELWFNNRVYIATDIDGFYASSSFFNGADFDFEGSVLDASLRGGLKLTDYLEAYLNLRFIGGTAKGVSKNADSPDGFTDNRLATINVSIRFQLK